MNHKRLRWLSALCLAATCVAASCLWHAGQGGGLWMVAPASAGEEPPPLKLDLSTPLLLDEPGDKPSGDQAAKTADNAACYVCHGNYEEEPLAAWHAAKDVGCVDCHGPSHAHTNDEDNITPPDVMYPAEKVDPACAECHHWHKAPATEVIARFLERCPQKTDLDKLICTDCHGMHRLKSRTTRWDKRTRAVIVDGPAKVRADR
jgi:hypothetical protein